LELRNSSNKLDLVTLYVSKNWTAFNL